MKCAIESMSYESYYVKSASRLFGVVWGARQAASAESHRVRVLPDATVSTDVIRGLVTDW